MRGIAPRPSRGGLYDQVHEHLDFMFDVVVEGPPRPRSLRSSSLPYCPVLDVLLPREAEQATLDMSLYSGMGTAAHSALQLFATVGPPGGRVWGCWKCPRCGHEWRNQHRPDACPSGCNDAPLYVEMSYRLQIASGHSDLVVEYPLGWVVHEYKTCGFLPSEPNRKHVLQARTYCHMLRRLHRISPSYVIIYIERKHLQRRVFGPYDASSSAQQVSDWTNRSIHGFRAASAARKSPTPGNLMEVARLRPCHDEATFDEYMARDYQFSKKPCEMLGTCSGCDRDVARSVHDLLRG